MKYTQKPRPWSVFDNGKISSTESVYGVKDANGLIIITRLLLSDALLISKAPAMYEALKKLKSHTEWALNDPSDSWRPPEWIAKEIHAVVTSALEGL